MKALNVVLQQPIPDQAEALRRKAGYRSYPLNTVMRAGEPLVDIDVYGIAGQSYYSRVNGATGRPLHKADRAVLVRQTLAEKLAAINHALQTSDEVAGLLGGQVELYVEEGYRSPETQSRLYEEVFPELIRKQHPGLSDVDILARRDELIAHPSTDPDSPSPHSTGAAVDVKLRYMNADNGFVRGAGLEMGHVKQTGNTARPDFLEHSSRSGAKDEIARRNRRVFYWVMRGALLAEDSGLAVNPTEWWHWSYGDQMWAALTQAPQAFFPLARP